jgi:hypothetical protein
MRILFDKERPARNKEISLRDLLETVIDSFFD